VLPGNPEKRYYPAQFGVHPGNPGYEGFLMRHFLSRLIPLQIKPALRRVWHLQIKPALRRLWPWRYQTFYGIRVHYMYHLDGGGRTFGQGFIPYLRNRGMPMQARTFEWCAGPGFIGFSLLGVGLTETLCLADINPQAVAACQRTIKDNALAACVNVYQSDNLANIPQSEQWDLVVGNPPVSGEYVGDRLALDPDWRIHRTFFAQIGGHLKPGGIIILQENNSYSTSETFQDMILSAGLDIVFVEFGSKRRTPYINIYYLGVARRGDAVPDWARGSIFSSGSDRT
jgi:Methyltransferase small domain